MYIYLFLQNKKERKEKWKSFNNVHGYSQSKTFYKCRFGGKRESGVTVNDYKGIYLKDPK